MSDRLEQLLGIVSLTAIDRMRTALATGGATMPAGATEAAALVHLQAWPGASVNELAGVIGRSQPATVRLVDRLVERDLVTREEGIDRRTLALALTDRGERSATDALVARADALAGLLDGLSDAERSQLERLLARVTGTLVADHRDAIHACRMCDRGACFSGPGCPLEHVTGVGVPGNVMTRRTRR